MTMECECGWIKDWDDKCKNPSHETVINLKKQLVELRAIKAVAEAWLQRMPQCMADEEAVMPIERHLAKEILAGRGPK